MKKMISLALALTFVLGILMTFTGCINDSEAPSEKAAVCFVVANTANSKGLNLNSPLVQDTIFETALNYGYVSVINADGVPETVAAKSLDIEDRFKGASKERLTMDARAKATSLITGMNALVADDPEVDYIESLSLAVRSLSSLEGYDSKTIIVIGTGISTTGVLNFNNNLMSAEPETIVDMLEERECIPDFTGIKVYFQQLGDVAAPQKKLTGTQLKKLQRIYDLFVERGNGEFFCNDIIANPVNEDIEYPYVTPVDFPDETPIIFDADVLSSEDDKAFQEPVILGESQVEFRPDEAQYLHPDKAQENIRPVAEYLLEHESVELLLAGTTAGDENTEAAVKLSEMRAERVKETLVSMGVDAERITVKGMGSDNPWHIPGVGYEGAAASGNRKVVLLDMRTETAGAITGQMNH